MRAACLTIFLALACCSSFAVQGEAESSQPGVGNIHFLIPGGAGGGWDRTARGVGQALVAAGLIQGARYENMSGGGGAKGIAHVIELDAPNMWLVNSTPIITRSLQNIFPQSFRDLTPIASAIGDYSAIVVREQSDIYDVATLAARQRQDPRKIAIAGGSVTGSTDHIVAAMIFKGFGADPRSTKYIPYDAGGKAMAGLLSGEVQALSSGLGEVIDLTRQGWVRILCVTATTRLTTVPDVPTCRESGAADAVFVNWRGFFAGPSLAPAKAANYQDVIARMYDTPHWRTIRDRNGWVDIFNAGADFTSMLEEQERTIGTLMQELGLL